MYRLNHHIWGNQDLEPSEKLLLLYLLLYLKKNRYET
jgi:hypothetical protein